MYATDPIGGETAGPRLCSQTALCADCRWVLGQGHYDVAPAIWAVAHTTQFTQPGWRLLKDSGWLAGGGSFVGYVSPRGDEITLVIEKLSAAASSCERGELDEKRWVTGPGRATFKLQGSFRSLKTLALWASDFSVRTAGQMPPDGGLFRKLPEVEVVDGDAARHVDHEQVALVVQREQDRAVRRERQPADVPARLKREGEARGADQVKAGDPVADGTVQRAAVGAEDEVTLAVDRAAQVAERVVQPRHGSPEEPDDALARSSRTAAPWWRGWGQF